MEKRQLGKSKLYVAPLCLGGNVFGWTADEEMSFRVLDGFVDAGFNFIDTADVYSIGESEKLTGQALKDLGTKRSDIVLATKVFARMAPGPNDIGASRGHIMDGVAKSLDRLKMDHIDLYQIHQTDLVTPVEETMRALDDLVRQGMVRYIGVSNWTAWRIMKANGIAGARGQERFETVQAYYSLTGRELERELVPMMEEERIGCLVWSPLAGGYLSGKYSEGGEGGAEGRRKNFDFPPVDRSRGEPIIAAMRPIAKAHNTSVARVALAWVLSKTFVTSVIIGARTVEQLDDNLEATKLKLTAEEIGKLDELSAIAEDYPHWMISRFKGQRIPEEK